MLAQIEINGSLTSYFESGDATGQPLVFVHGFRGDHHGLLKIADAFLSVSPNSHRIIIPDLPGFGASAPLLSTHSLTAYGNWLRAFVSQIAGENTPIVAHSFGTMVTANALSQGLSPAKLALINPISAPALAGPRAVLTRVALAYYRLAKALPAHAGNQLLANPFVVRIMSEIMTKTSDKQLRAWIHSQHAQYFSVFANRDMLLEAFTASVSHTVADYAEYITMPTAVIAGTQDDITPLIQQLNFVKSLSAAKLYPLTGVGHLVHYEAAAEAAQLVSELLAA